MLIDPRHVCLPVETGRKWSQALTEVISAGIGAGMGITSADEALEAISITAWSDQAGALHMRATAPWGRWAQIDSQPEGWLLMPGGFSQ